MPIETESLDLVTVVSEYRLGFGVSLSPNIAQRFAEAVLDSFRRRFDAQEEIFFNRILDSQSQQCTAYNDLDALTVDEDGWTKVCWWIHERRKLTQLTGRNQLRRYSVHQYTDDACFTVVSRPGLDWPIFVALLLDWSSQRVKECPSTRLGNPGALAVAKCYVNPGLRTNRLCNLVGLA